MKLDKLWPLLAALALSACQSGPAAPAPTPPLATISALLSTTLAAFQLPGTPTREPSATPFPSATVAAYPGLATAEPFTPLPPAPIIGRHVVQPSETIFCIARGYGVLPAAIAQANALSQTLFISPGQVLQIPEVQWSDIAPGPVCAPQFASPFPGLPAPTATLEASAAPAGQPLAVSLDYRCIANCGSKAGNYELQVDVLAGGGVKPYTYHPAQSYDLTLPHCTTGQGTATVNSADGQIAQASWAYHDAACP